MEGYSVIIHPPFDELNKMVDLFQSKGFDDYLKFYVYKDHCDILFKSYSRAQDFIDYFDNYHINSIHISASMSKNKINQYIDVDFKKSSNDNHGKIQSRIPKIHSKTVAVKNYPIDELTDRNIWNDFRTTGFIRQIETRGSTAYIQYDTEDDALDAIDSMDGVFILGSRISVELIPDRILNLPDVVVPLIIADKQREPKDKGS